jgi:hypothetical protein
MPEKGSLILPGTVDKIIQSSSPSELEQAQIGIEGADHLRQELRIDNMLRAKSGQEFSLKLGAQVELVIEAEVAERESELAGEAKRNEEK